MQAKYKQYVISLMELLQNKSHVSLVAFSLITIYKNYIKHHKKHQNKNTLSKKAYIYAVSKSTQKNRVQETLHYMPKKQPKPINFYSNYTIFLQFLYIFSA